MIIAFQILLLFMILASFAFSFSKELDSKSKTNAGIICLASITAFIFTIAWF